MKKITALIISLVCLILLSSCNSQTQAVKYNGADADGNTADKIVSAFIESNIDKDDKISLVNLSECYVAEDYEPDELATWFEGAFAYCVVQTKAEYYCNEDCSIGKKGETQNINYAYFLTMETKDSQWKIVDYGYPPVK